MADDFKDTLDTTEDTVKEEPAAHEATPEPEKSKEEPEAQAPVATPAAATPSTPHVNTPGVVVLQWLTYAFWGWLILGLIWLVSVILLNAILKTSVSEVVPYAVAVTIILLPIAFVTDLMYRKHEPAKKTGAAMVIMVIHAVIFALLGIGALIIAAFVGLNAAINIGENINTQMVGLFTALAAAVLYVAAFARTLNPFKSKMPVMMYGISMLVVSLMLLIAAVAGPIVQSVVGRNDKLIEQNLTSVQRAVSDYIDDKKALPKSLDDVQVSTKGGKDLVSKNLVEYIPGTTKNTASRTGTSTTTTYQYELCVTYAAASSSNGYSYNGSYSQNDSYTSYLYTNSHDAGRVCYKLKDTTYDYTKDTTTNSSSSSSSNNLQN